MIVLLTLSAYAIEREDTLDQAAEFAFHEWTMTSVNETASCTTGYESDYTAGTHRGLPYDWGGYYTIEEYDAAIADGLGAGSHSWHGILSCTAGLDCSGFLSQVWDAPHNSTSTFHTVTSDIAVTDLLRADAVNDAGSHVVLYTYETDAGMPVFYEAAGSAQRTRLNSGSGWSYLDGYQPIRYDGIEDGGSTATVSEPIEIISFPFEDFRWTAGAASDVIDSYSCAPSTDESGPEVLYEFSVAQAGTLHAVVSDDEGVDVDLHVMTAANGAECVARHDSEVTVEVGPGRVWLSLDTYVGTREFPGPFLLTVTFDGVVGEPPPIDTGEPPDTADTSDTAAQADGLPFGRTYRESGGLGACDTSGSSFALLGVGIVALIARRRAAGV
jgi:hypothetical protein